MKGYVLSPRLFKIFIAAVLIVALQRFSEDADILTELVYLQEQPREPRPESSIDCVRRAVWGMLYAGDACMYRDRREHLQNDGGYRPRMRRVWPNCFR